MRRKRSVRTLNGHSRSDRGGPTPEYRAWQNMLNRCRDKHPHFANYGGRGIRVCERWLVFTNFFSDMGARPSPNHSLDRIDNDGNYEPGNVRWATLTEQQRNTRHTVMIEHEGRKRPLRELAEEFGLHPPTLLWRVRNGWPMERALAAPRGGKK